jgi:2-polyprenyl-6-methoxyphenol hydroxylase-like FAD-dependent oxidoreductase
VLKVAFPRERYHNGFQLESLAQDEDGVTACFKDGRRERADLLVAADGIRSTVRQMLLPQARPEYAGYIAWRGLVEESALSERTLEELFPYFAFGLPPHEQMIAYPVAGKDNAFEPGKRRFNFVWYRPAAEATTLRDMVTDASGKVWLDGIPPPLIRPEVLDDARRAARQVLAPQFAEVVEKTENLFFQPIFDLESSRLAFGRVALLGDAAFVARPHCGMGVTKAASDALALTRALQADADVAAALQRYGDERAPVGAAVVRHARHLGAYMQAQLRDEGERQMAERYRTPEAVMRETAVSRAFG